MPASFIGRFPAEYAAAEWATDWAAGRALGFFNDQGGLVRAARKVRFNTTWLALKYLY